MTSAEHTIVNPSAAILVWNYKDRINSEKPTDPDSIAENVIISASVISIRTSKSKSSPNGQFELVLAPTFNWTARLTPGSWCTIMMSRETMDPISAIAPGRVSEKTFKMFGRINSVRAVVSVNQATGARTSSFIVSGEDWGCIFNSPLYIDPIARNNDLEEDSFVSFGARLAFQKIITDWQNGGKALPTASDWVDSIIKLWGDPLGSGDLGAANSVAPQISFTSDIQFTIPASIVLYMGFLSKSKLPSIAVAALINQVEGVLKSYNKYTKVVDARGYPDPNSFFGVNSIWQQIVNNGNSTLNEFIAEIDFQSENSASLTLYRRIKPFIINDSSPGLNKVKDLISYFKNIKKHDISDSEIIRMDAGTNFRDKFNFVEIRPQPLFDQSFLDNPVKRESQEFDKEAFKRDGFKPMFEPTMYMPYKDDPRQAPFEVLEWKHLLKEWYFNTHLMLNGSVTFIGKSEYIAVGDNISIPTTAFGAPFNSNKKDKPTFLLAHVESISHEFTVSDTGARSFITSIDFSRGILVDAKNNPIDKAARGAIDQNADSQKPKDEKNKNIVPTSTPLDTDVLKLKGR